MKNWKTTLAGLASGVAYVVTGQPDWKHILVAVFMALTGIAAKDFNVTGGTVPQAGGTIPATYMAAPDAVVKGK